MQIPTQTLTIRDRNLIAFLLVAGLQADFIPRSDNGLDADFQLSPELDNACKAYMSNCSIPVQSFISACRLISDRIRDHRNRQGVRHA